MDNDRGTGAAELRNRKPFLGVLGGLALGLSGCGAGLGAAAPTNLTGAPASNSAAAPSHVRIALHPDPQDGKPALPVATAAPVTLPVFPKSLPVSTFPLSYMPRPSTPYLQDGYADLMAPAGGSTVEAWVKQALQQDGFVASGTSRIGNIQGGTWVSGESFTSKTDPFLAVDVLFLLGKAQTAVRYWVTDVVLPPRPANSTVTGSVSAADLQVRPNQPGASWHHVSLHNPSDLATLMRVVNALPLSSGGVLHCTADFGGSATIDLTSGTRHWIFTETPACSEVTMSKGPVLSDPGLQLWHTVLGLAGAHA